MGDTEFPQGPNHNEEEALRRWYVAKSFAPGSWRAALGNALRTDGWEPVFSANGVIVLHLSDAAALPVGGSR